MLQHGCHAAGHRVTGITDPCTLMGITEPMLSWELQSPYAHPRRYSVGVWLMSMLHTAALD